LERTGDDQKFYLKKGFRSAHASPRALLLGRGNNRERKKKLIQSSGKADEAGGERFLTSYNDQIPVLTTVVVALGGEGKSSQERGGKGGRTSRLREIKAAGRGKERLEGFSGQEFIGRPPKPKEPKARVEKEVAERKKLNFWE